MVMELNLYFTIGQMYFTLLFMVIQCMLSLIFLDIKMKKGSGQVKVSMSARVRASRGGVGRGTRTQAW